MNKLDKRNIEDIFALTPMQEGMLFHYLEDPESDYYFEQLSLEISGEIDTQLFEKAWDFVIQTNEMLRTVFRWENVENPIQIILKKHHLQLKYHELPGEEGNEKKKQVEKIKSEDRRKKFHLREVPFRVTLCKLKKAEHVMIISNHHIIYDGWSNAILLEEFFTAYDDLSNGKDLVKPIKTKFKEFIKWIQEQDKNRQKHFWQGYLKGVDTRTKLQPGQRRGEKAAENYQIFLTQDLKETLEDFIKNNRFTLASFFYSAWGVLLQKYCNSADVIFGTTVSGRSAPIKGIEDMVGLFINTVPLRVTTSVGEKVKDLLCKINDILPLRETYESTSLIDIKGSGKLENNEALFDSIVVLENYPLNRWVMEESSPLSLVVRSYSMVETTTYNLTIGILIGDTIKIAFNYNKASFDVAAIRRLARHFINIIKNILIDYRTEIPGLRMLAEEEKSRILYDFNRTAEKYPEDKMIQELFEEQVEKTPDNIALIFQDKALTYQGLNKKANQLAYLLQSKGIQPNTLVGLMVERFLEMLIGILSILKAGGGYLPIDPGYPGKRIQYMLKDSGTEILLTSPLLSENFEKLSIVNCQLLIVNEKPPNSQRLNNPPGEANNNLQLKSTNLAYVIYTSGSTGKSKGVLVEHYSVVNLAFSQKRQFDINENDRVLQFSSICFDASVEQIFIALLSGAVLVLVDRNTLLDSSKFEEFISSRSITHLHAVPSFLSHVKVKDTFKLKRVISGGDVCPVALAKKWSKYCDFYNEYGPTETTVTSIEMKVGPEDVDESLSRLPVGKPIGNTTVYLFDKWKNPVPLGVVGELYIGGDGVARGYLNRPELTAEKFLYRTDRFYRSYRSYKTYKTGDLARWLPDGIIEFIGRIDQQIKIRGFRVEPGEIENHLLKQGKIKDAVVLAKEDERGDKYLVAYIVPGRDSEALVYQLREYLLKVLPDYMVPTYFMEIDKVPLTPTGKIHRGALPAPEIRPGERYVAPRHEIEKKLVEIWSQILARDTLSAVQPQLKPAHHPKIGIDDNFFQLGGHSLKATVLVAKIHKVFNVRLPLMEIFKTPTIRALSQYIKGAAEDRCGSIGAIEEKEYYWLSSAQKRLYFLQQMDETSTVYNMSSAWILEGVLDKDRLEQTFKKTIQRHESLRTSFKMVGEKPVQRIHDGLDFEINYFDSKIVQVEEGEQTTDNRQQTKEGKPGNPLSSVLCLLSSEFIRPFDLSNVPLLRVGLLKLPHTPAALRSRPSQEGIEHKHILVVDMHHIISDGLSTELLVQDFTALYSDRELPGMRLRYKDYAQWQNREKESPGVQEQGQYWQKEFEAEIPVLDLPTDYVRPGIQRFEGSSLSFEINRATSNALKALALEEGATLYMALLAIYAAFLSKISNQEDIVIGTPAAGRRHGDFKKIIGMFVNTLALRLYPGGEKTFTAFLAEVKEKTLQAFENQEYQYEDLVEQVAVNRDLSRNPLFDVSLLLQDMEVSQLTIPGLKLTPYEYEIVTSKFDLTLEGKEAEETLLFCFKYSTNLFKRGTIERFIRYFRNIVSGILENKDRKILELTVLTDEERNRVLYDFNKTRQGYPRDKMIQELFEEQVDRTPDNTALIFDDKELTYRELNNRSDQLAHLLQFKGFQLNTLVGLMVERSIEMIIGILGVLKIGAAYLPLDAGYPGKRLRYMVEDSHCQLLLTQDHLLENLKFKEAVVKIDIDDESIYTNNGVNPNPGIVKNSKYPAYVIYTSGSTGKPRGVVVEHFSVVNLVFFQENLFEITEKNRVLQFSTICFDASVEQIFIALFSGAALVLIDKATLLDTNQFEFFVASRSITHLHAVPLFLQNMRLKDTFNLERIVSGGDVCPPTLAKKWNRYCDFYNKYGPTETTITSIEIKVEPEDADGSLSRLPVGKPISNTMVYLFDQWKNPVPLGVVGELYIGGDGVARGYLNNPELTAERFNHDLWDYQDYHYEKKANNNCKQKLLRGVRARGPYKRIYRTGDLGRWLPGGNIEFLGRLDHQVKVRGFRIELGEIEKHLLKHGKVKEAVVVAREDKGRDKYLAAYMVPDRESEISFPGLRGYLLKVLPDYMVPSYFMQVDEIPLTPTGKIDRRALPAPEISPGEGEGYAAPRDKIEEKLVEVWSEVLGIEKDRIGIDDDFFQLGGHSLKATLLAAKVKKELAVNVKLPEIFKTPYIRGLAAYIKESVKEKYMPIEPVEVKEYYELSPAQKRLFILNKINDVGVVYNLPSAWIIKGPLDIRRLKITFDAMISRHESLRTSFEMIDGEPIQRVHNGVEFEIRYYDMKEVEEEQKIEDRRQKAGTQADTHLSSEFIRPFDLSQAPLLRVGILKEEEEKHILMLDIHHIITDGFSLRIFMKDFTSLYTGTPLPPLQIHYKDFSQWQNCEKNKKYQEKQGAYWLEKFKDGVPKLNFPTDYPRPPVQSFSGDSLHFALDHTLTGKLKEIAGKTGTTLNMVLAAVLYILVSIYSGQGEVVVAIGIAGRTHPDLENMIGFFVNSLVIRSQPEGDKTFQQFLEEVKQNTLEAYENQDYPFDNLVDRLNLSRDSSRNPLFDILFTQEDFDAQELEINGLKFTPYEFTNKTSRVDLVLYAFNAGETIKMVLEYSTALFKPSTTENIAQRYIEILRQVTANKKIKLKDIEISFKLKDAALNKHHEDYGDFDF